MDKSAGRWHVASKKLAILVKYYLRSASKRMLGLFPFLLFLCSFALFTIVVVPPLGQRLAFSILDYSPKTLRVAGLVSEQTKDPKGRATFRPLSGVVIECGGFRTTTDSSGKYELVFHSQMTEGIPIILRRGNQETIDRITFLPNNHRIRKDFTLR